jgi:hypothetical protein
MNPSESRLYLCNATYGTFMGFIGMGFLPTFLAIGGIGFFLLRRFERCHGMHQGSPIAEARAFIPVPRSSSDSKSGT